MDLKSNHRIFIAGKSGMGKTVVAKHIVSDFPHLVAFDDKHTLEIPRARYISTVAEFKKAPGGRLIFRPPIELISNIKKKRALLNDFFWAAYNKGNMVVWLDEVFAVVPKANQTPDGLQAIITRGREKNIGLIALSQWIAYMQMFKDQAEHFFILRLRSEKEHARARELVGNVPIEDLKPFEFYYDWDGGDGAIKDQLDLKTNRAISGRTYKLVPAKLIARGDAKPTKRRYRVL